MDTLCGLFVWTLFVDNLCGHFLVDTFLDTFSGHFLWTLFLDTFLVLLWYFGVLWGTFEYV